MFISGFMVVFAALVVEVLYSRRTGCMRCCGYR